LATLLLISSAFLVRFIAFLVNQGACFAKS